MNVAGQVLRRLAAFVGVVGVLTLASCGVSVEVVILPITPTATPIWTSAPPLAMRTSPASPTVAVTPTSTPTPAATTTPEMTATTTPEMTATASAALVGQWSASAQQVETINSGLADIGTRFQNGTLSLADGAGQLGQLDQQASAVARTIDDLAPMPGVDVATLGRYRQTVDQWAAAVHDVTVTVANNDIFGAPGAISHLQQLASDVEQQMASLGLPRRS